MSLVKITAILRRERLEAVEARLQEAGVSGITVSTVKGYGEYARFFSHDWLVTHARLEIFAAEQNCQSIVEAVRNGACTGEAGDGIIAVLPVRRLIRIRTGDQTVARLRTPDDRDVAPARGVQRNARPRMTSFLAWIIVLLSLGGGATVMFVASRHQMHFLAALLAVVLVLCGTLGGLAFSRRNGTAAAGGSSGDHVHRDES